MLIYSDTTDVQKVTAASTEDNLLTSRSEQLGITLESNHTERSVENVMNEAEGAKRKNEHFSTEESVLADDDMYKGAHEPY